MANLKTIIKILTTPAPWVHWHVANQWRQHGPVSLCSKGRIYIVQHRGEIRGTLRAASPGRQAAKRGALSVEAEDIREIWRVTIQLSEVRGGR